MDVRWLLRGAGAWLALAAGSVGVTVLTWASMRSLYPPGVGANLGFDAGIGFLVGAGLLIGAWRVHEAHLARAPRAINVAWLSVGGVALGIVVSAVMARWTRHIASAPSSGFLDGLDYVLLAGGAIAWVALGLLVLAIVDRSWRGFFTLVTLTAGALGSTAILFSVFLWAEADALAAAARAREEASGLALGLVLVAILAVARGRRRA